jgi:hypothetical protein
VIDPARNVVSRTLVVGQGPLAVAEVAGDAWISNSTDGEIWRLHP